MPSGSRAALNIVSRSATLAAMTDVRLGRVGKGIAVAVALFWVAVAVAVIAALVYVFG